MVIVNTAPRILQKKLSSRYTLPVYSEILERAFNSIPSRIVVFRLDSPLLQAEELFRECKELCKQTKYKKCAKREEAPAKADCLTSIHYLFRKRIDLLVDWIGNMPRRLAKQRDWRIYELARTELKPGDLIFLKHKRSCRVVTHIAIALSPEKFFHCSTEKRGGAIETIDGIFASYAQPALKAMLSYTDPRTISWGTSLGRDG